MTRRDFSGWSASSLPRTPPNDDDALAEHFARASGEAPRNARQLLAADDSILAEASSERPAHGGHERATTRCEHAVDIARADARACEHLIEHTIDGGQVLGDPAVEVAPR